LSFGQSARSGLDHLIRCAISGSEFQLRPGAGVERETEGAFGGAARAIDVPARQRAGRGGINFDEPDRAVVEVEQDAREIVAVFCPDVAAQLGKDAHRFGREHELPELIDKMRAPVVQAAAAEGGFVAPLRAPFAGGGADATGPLAEAGFDVDDSAEGSVVDGAPDGEIVDVPAAILEDTQDAAAFFCLVDDDVGLGEIESDWLFDHDVLIRGEGDHRVVKMHGGRGRDQDGFKVAAEKIVDVAEGAESARCCDIAPGLCRIKYRGEARVIGRIDPCRMLSADAPETNDADRDLIHPPILHRNAFGVAPLAGAGAIELRRRRVGRVDRTMFIRVLGFGDRGTSAAIGGFVAVDLVEEGFSAVGGFIDDHLHRATDTHLGAGGPVGADAKPAGGAKFRAGGFGGGAGEGSPGRGTGEAGHIMVIGRWQAAG
jgi:hypothetical protein